MGPFYLCIKFQNFLGGHAPHPFGKIGRLALVVWACGPQKLPTPTFQFPTSTFHLFETPDSILSGRSKKYVSSFVSKSICCCFWIQVTALPP